MAWEVVQNVTEISRSQEQTFLFMLTGPADSLEGRLQIPSSLTYLPKCLFKISSTHLEPSFMDLISCQIRRPFFNDRNSELCNITLRSKHIISS